MPAPSAAELVALMRQSGVVEPGRLTAGLPGCHPNRNKRLVFLSAKVG